MVGCDSLKVVTLVRIQAPQLFVASFLRAFGRKPTAILQRATKIPSESRPERSDEVILFRYVFCLYFRG